MKITRNNSGTKINLVLEPNEGELEKLKKHVLGHFKESVKVPGFREGTAPLHLVEKNANQALLTDEFINHAVNEFYRKAVEVEKLRPVGQPQVTIKKFVPYSQLNFEVEFDSIPPIVLPNYKKIKLAKKPVSVTAKDINDVLENLKQRLGERQTVDRPAKLGDEIVMDFDGYDKKGAAVPGASGKSYQLHLGSKSFIPGFEEALVGLKAGEAKEFKLRFPETYSIASLADQEVEFKVKVNNVNEITDPKLDNDFAAKAGPFKTLAELKADIKKQLTFERQNQADREYENDLVRKIVERSKIEVPESLVEQEVISMEEAEKRDLTFRGQTWDEHLAAEGVTEEQHRERNKPNAEQRVKGGLALSEIAEKEKIQATQAEVDKKIEELKAQNQDPEMQAELAKEENRNQIVAQILTEKTLAMLVAKATSSKK